MANITNIATGIIRRYGVQNVRIINGHKNPYESRIPGAVLIDPGLYKSALGTPVMSDITFGDKLNDASNQWTDKNDKVHSFKPVTLYTVLFNINQPKRIIETEIQGSDGSVKEYIGMGDYEIEIDGMIVGPNGHYPIDEVRQLKDIVDAPIPIVVTSWYLQNLDIHNIVIKSCQWPQEEGGYSYQQFTISAKSDLPIELKITQ